METCIFCDVYGSAARAESLQMELASQIDRFKAEIGGARNSKSFLVYFQSYTSTFSKIPWLRSQYEKALSYPFVKGLIIGTRPDCLSPSLLKLWQEFHDLSFVGVELGVQSFSDEKLEFLKRGHSGEASIAAIRRIAKETTVDIGIHLMFGLPNEADSEIIEAAHICNDLPITNVKLHNLHVLKDTGLEILWREGKFVPVSREVYTDKVALFLSHLRPDIYVHRLAAFASRGEECLAPDWTTKKMDTHQFIVAELRRRQIFQSKNYLAKTDQSLTLQKCLGSHVVQLQNMTGNSVFP